MVCAVLSLTPEKSLCQKSLSITPGEEARCMVVECPVCISRRVPCMYQATSREPAVLPYSMLFHPVATDVPHQQLNSSCTREHQREQRELTCS